MPEPRSFEEREVLPDGIVIYHLPNHRNPVINLLSGHVDCDCPDWEMRRLKQAREDGVRPDIGDCRYHCKHIKKAVADCIRRGDIVLTLRSWIHQPRQGRIYDEEFRKMTGGREQMPSTGE